MGISVRNDIDRLTSGVMVVRFLERAACSTMIASGTSLVDDAGELDWG